MIFYDRDVWHNKNLHFDIYDIYSDSNSKIVRSLLCSLHNCGMLDSDRRRVYNGVRSRSKRLDEDCYSV